MILQNQRNSSDRRKSGIMLAIVLGKRSKAKSTSLAESRCAKDSADLNIYFQPKLCGFGDTGHATK